MTPPKARVALHECGIDLNHWRYAGFSFGFDGYYEHRSNFGNPVLDTIFYLFTVQHYDLIPVGNQQICVWYKGKSLVCNLTSEDVNRTCKQLKSYFMEDFQNDAT